MSLKLSNHLFTGPFDVLSHVVRKNHRLQLFAIVLKSGEPWAPSFDVIETGVANNSPLSDPEDVQRKAWSESCGGENCLYLLSPDLRAYPANERENVLKLILQEVQVRS